MSRVRFRCPSCAELIVAPAALEGQQRPCPKCGAEAVWPPPDPQPPAYQVVETQVAPEGEADESSPGGRQSRTPRPAVPPEFALLSYALSAGALATAAMPCIWFAAVPVAAVALVVALYSAAYYRCSELVHVCVAVAVALIIYGLSRADEVNEMLRRLQRM